MTTLIIRMPYKTLASLLALNMEELDGTPLPHDLAVVEVAVGPGDQAKEQCWMYISSEMFRRHEFSTVEVQSRWDHDHYVDVPVRAKGER